MGSSEACRRAHKCRVLLSQLCVCTCMDVRAYVLRGQVFMLEQGASEGLKVHSHVHKCTVCVCVCVCVGKEEGQSAPTHS